MDFLTHTRELCCHLWTKLESFTLKVHALDKFGRDEFIARWLISNILSIEYIGHPREEDSTKKITYMRVLVIVPEPSRSIDYFFISWRKCIHHRDVVENIIFAISILDEYIVTRYVLDCGTYRSSFSTIFPVKVDFYNTIFYISFR